MYYMLPPRHYIRSLIIFTIAVCLPFVLIIGLIAHVSLLDLIVMGLMAIIIGFVGAFFIGWLFLRFIYQQFRNNCEKQVANSNSQVNHAEKIFAEYELNNDEVLSFYLSNYERSPTLGKVSKLLRRTLLLAIAVELLAALVLGTIFGKQYITLVLVLSVFALLTLLYYVFFPSLMQRNLKGTVARNYGQGKDKLTGKHKLTITSDAVTDVTEIGETITSWNAIEWIESTGQYLFMTVRGSRPFIVPRRVFADEQEFKQFVDTAKAYHQAAEESNHS